jgi:hypothetical protein
VANKSRRKTAYNAIIARPTRADIRWLDIISLLKYLGCKIEKRETSSGTQLIFAIGPLLKIFHPRRLDGVATRRDVDKIRIFLGEINKLKLKR